VRARPTPPPVARASVLIGKGDTVGTGDCERWVRQRIADRENDRIQTFDQEGNYSAEWQVQRPTQIATGPDGLVYVAELWCWRGLTTPTGTEVTSDRYGRLSLLDTEGRVLARHGGGLPNTPGSFTAPHGVAVDSRGAVYLAEVTWTIGVGRGS
jgi:hypothetical protein